MTMPLWPWLVSRAAEPPAPHPVIPDAARLVAGWAGEGITDPAVLRAMQVVPRDRFVPAELRASAWLDRPLPIGWDQTISQPLVVAFMTQALKVAPGHGVLEVGTGSGYQAAVLAELGARVWSIEIVEPVAAFGARNLEVTGYLDRVTLRVGDGYRGWPEAAPFDRILVTAAPDHVPQPLLEQLAPGGILVLPVGADHQVVRRITRGRDGGQTVEDLLPVRFVPMTGEAERR
jgi:protein-L-isoaspartate(D-aspartate) O-methyltransferase